MRIEFFGLPAHGHTNPTLPVVQELVRRGHQVRYWSYSEFQIKLEDSGAEFADLAPYVQLHHTGFETNLFRFANQLLQGSQAVLEGLLPSFRNNPPDLIIYDSLATWGRLLAHALHIPSVCSTTTFALNDTVTRSSSQQFQGFLMMLLQALPQALRFEWHSFQLAKRFGLPKCQLPEMFSNPAALNVVYTSRAFQPHAETFSDAYCFVGPSLNLEQPQRLDWSWLQDQPLIYVSLGTLINDNLGFYHRCFEALSTLPVKVMMSVGLKINIADLGIIPENFIIQPFVPQLEVLKHTNVFVTHGGMNSVHESLALGVPMVVIPQASDQRWVAEQVAHTKAGLLLEKDFSSAALQQAVQTMLQSPEYQQNAQQIGQTMLSQGGAVKAVQEIERYVSENANKSDHPRQDTAKLVTSSMAQ